MKMYRLEFLTYPFNIPYAPQVFLALTFLAAFCFLFGIFKRVGGVVLFLLLFILKQRNGFILDGSDNVIQVVLPFLIFANSYRYFTYEVKLFKNVKFNLEETNFARIIMFLAGAALMAQVCYVYFFTALAKLQGNLWLNGTAVYYTMRVDEFRATDWNIWLTKNHYFVVFATYFTVLVELAFAFLVWFRQTKFFILPLVTALHVGIWVFMRIDNFSWVMISTYFAFVTDEEYRRAWSWLKERFAARRVIVFYDDWCPNCTKFARFVSTLDFTRQIDLRGIRVESALHEFPGIDRSKAIQQMASYSYRKKRVYYGFDSLYLLAKTMPLLFIIRPLMFIFKVSLTGSLLYKELAIRRKIIPILCNERCPTPAEGGKR